MEVPDTLDWTAPKLLRDGGRAASVMADIYSLGITWWEIVTLCAANPTDRLGPPLGMTDDAATGRRGSIFGQLTHQKWRPQLSGVKLPQQLHDIYERSLGDDKDSRPLAAQMQAVASSEAAKLEGGAFTTANSHGGAMRTFDKSSRAVSSRGMAM